MGDEVTVYRCLDCGWVFADPDVQKDPDEDACPCCGSFEITDTHWIEFEEED